MSHMRVLDFTNDAVYYLGYPLALGSAQRAVLHALADLPDAALDTDALARKSGVGRSNIAATVAAINKRAFVIGGRTLILSGRGQGYHLSEY